MRKVREKQRIVKDRGGEGQLRCGEEGRGDGQERYGRIEVSRAAEGQLLVAEWVTNRLSAAVK